MLEENIEIKYSKIKDNFSKNTIPSLCCGYFIESASHLPWVLPHLLKFNKITFFSVFIYSVAYVRINN